MTKHFSEAEENLKQERRKAACLQRELEQLTFSHQNFEQSSHSELRSLREKVSFFK